MHREHLQYLYQYMTKFKSGFFTEMIRLISYILLNYTYIDDLRRVIPENVEVAMFADDVSLFSSHPNKEVAEAAI